jgi:tetratricopeptide (TPR) repeat protein
MYNAPYINNCAIRPSGYLSIGCFVIIGTFVLFSCSKLAENKSSGTDGIKLNIQALCKIDERLDSLRIKFSNLNDCDLYDSLATTGLQFVDKQNYIALDYFTVADKVAQMIGDSLRIVKAGRTKAQLFRRVHNLQRAVNEFQRVLPVAERNRFLNEVAMIYNGLGITYTFLAVYDEALRCHLRALEVTKQLGDPTDISMVLNNLGLLYHKIEHSEKALPYFLEAVEYSKRSKEQYDLGRMTANVALTYSNLRRLDNASVWIKETLNSCKRKCTQRVVIDTEFVLGRISVETQKLVKAEAHHTKSLQAASELNDTRFIAENLLALAEIAVIKGDLKTAESLFSKGYRIAEASDYHLLLSEFFRFSSVLYKKLGYTVKASECLAKYFQISDSVQGHEVINKIAALEIESQEKNTRLVINHKEKIVEGQAVLARLSIIIGVMLLIVIITLVIIIRHKRKLQVLSEFNINKETQLLGSASLDIQRLYLEHNHFFLKALREIRAPLATLQGVCQIALCEVRDDESRQYFQTVGDTAAQLRAFIEKVTVESIDFRKQSALTSSYTSQDKI